MKPALAMQLLSPDKSRNATIAVPPDTTKFRQSTGAHLVLAQKRQDTAIVRHGRYWTYARVKLCGGERLHFFLLANSPPLLCALKGMRSAYTR